MTEISAMYEALDNMDDYALMANVKPIGPHKVLTDAIAELEQLRQRVQELEKDCDEYHQVAMNHIHANEKLTAERDALLEANRIACEDLLERHDRIAELKQQRNELLAAAEAIEIDAEECLDFDECTAMLVPIDTYHKLMEAIASVKEKA